MYSSILLRKVPPPLLTFACLVPLNRVLVGMDPHHHAQLLLCLPTPQGQDAASAGTTPAGDQPHGLPGSLQFLHFSSSIKPKWVHFSRAPTGPVWPPNRVQRPADCSGSIRLCPRVALRCPVVQLKPLTLGYAACVWTLPPPSLPPARNTPRTIKPQPRHASLCSINWNGLLLPRKAGSHKVKFKGADPRPPS